MTTDAILKKLSKKTKMGEYDPYEVVSSNKMRAHPPARQGEASVRLDAVVETLAPVGASVLVKLALEEAADLLATAVVADAGSAFDDFVKKKTFKNPQTGNKVQYQSLPSEQKKKIYEEWKSKNATDDEVKDIAKKLNLDPKHVAAILRNPRPATKEGKAAVDDIVKDTDAFNDKMSSIKDDEEAEGSFKKTVRDAWEEGGGATLVAALLGAATLAPKWVPQALDAATRHPALAVSIAVSAALANLAFYASRNKKAVSGANEDEGEDMADRLWESMTTSMTEETMPKAANLAVSLVGM